MKYNVTFAIDASITVEVEADSWDAAEYKAQDIIASCDYEAIESYDVGEVLRIEREDGDYFDH